MAHNKTIVDVIVREKRAAGLLPVPGTGKRRVRESSDSDAATTAAGAAGPADAGSGSDNNQPRVKRVSGAKPGRRPRAAGMCLCAMECVWVLMRCGCSGCSSVVGWRRCCRSSRI